jgi:hypothetical protein
MDPPLEPRLRALLGFQLDERLRALDEEFGGLLDVEARLLLVADQEGLLPPPSADLEPAGRPALRDVQGTLERLSPTRTFRRPDGTVGFVGDLEVRTAQGLRRVVLWDGAVRQAQGLLGKPVRCTALAERARNGALELHSTRATQVERL